MSPFNLDDYVEVSERIVQFRERHPEGSLQAEILRYPEEGFPWIVVKGYAFRAASDERPGIGLAWEPVPGRTPYTKDSELQNAETAAWGRAIVAALAADTKRGIASRDEVRNRQTKAGSTPTPNREQGTTDGAPAASKPVSPPTTISDDAAETTLIPKAVTPQALLKEYGWSEVKLIGREVAMDLRASVPLSESQWLRASQEVVVEVASRLGHNQETLQGAP